THPGDVYFMDRGVNPQTGTMSIRLKFANPSNILRPGMSAKVMVRNQDTSAQLIIPAKAIVEQMGEYFVFIAKDTAIAPPAEPGKDAKPAAPAQPSLHAQQKKVHLGAAIADKVIVKSGLQEGDRVIVDGVQKLHDGSLILAK